MTTPSERHQENAANGRQSVGTASSFDSDAVDASALDEKNTAPAMQMPDAFVILFFIMLFAAVLSHLVPAGYFAATPSASLSSTASAPAVAEVVTHTATEKAASLDPAQFRYADSSTATQGVSWFAAGGGVGFFNYAFEGMVSGDKNGSAVGVVAFILLTGGAFGILLKTGAIHHGICALIQHTSRVDFLFIPLLFLLFSLGGAVFGMGEEAIAFCIILLPLMLALGYDAITTVLVTYVATQIGFATSWMNPFNVAIAQGIAGIPLFSGHEFRLLMWLVFTLFGMAYTMRYAAKVRANPKMSLSFAMDQRQRLAQPRMEDSQFSRLDQLILFAFFLGLGWIIWGVTTQHYYIPELASQFFTIGIVVGAIAVLGKRLSLNQVADGFKQGAADLLPAALIVGMAKGIVLLLGGDDPHSPSVLNTLLYHAALQFDGFSVYASAWLMLIMQSVINFFVSSGSGQAALTMPLIAPLADMIGLSRQIAVLAFQLGDGLTNCIIPTSAALIGCLGAVRLDWAIWLRFVWRLQLWLFGLASLFVVAAVAVQYQ